MNETIVAYLYNGIIPSQQLEIMKLKLCILTWEIFCNKKAIYRML